MDGMEKEISSNWEQDYLLEVHRSCIEIIDPLENNSSVKWNFSHKLIEND